MQADKILFPTDFSHTGDAALEMASSLARDLRATLFIVHVEEPPTAYGGGNMYYGALDPGIDELKRMLHDIKPADQQVPCEHHLIAGHPAGTIVQFADSQDVDLIVMGTHGRGGLSRLLMGSVAEAVVRRAPCPVLTYKQPQEKTAKAR
jgi:nucleotide-binding universal stress UspA family protein